MTSYLDPRNLEEAMREIRQSRKELATANERIRELESKLDRYTRISEAGLSLGDHLDCIESLTAEREVSDKLETALRAALHELQGTKWLPKLSVAIDEVSAIRANKTTGNSQG